MNAAPHIGFAMEIIRADIIARYKLSQGFDVFFNTGTDEHGLKIYRKAAEAGQDPQTYVDGYAEKFKALKSALGLWEGLNFIRTTDPHHVKAAQEFWKLCDKRGYIYKKDYKVKYCVGCELEKTDSELDEKGRCLLHPNLPIEVIDEENYFFKFSAFQKPLLDLYASRADFVVPDFRYNEIKAFVSRGLEDFSISRLAAKMPWGIPVPTDPAHTMYVWFDALVNYISAIGWPDDLATFQKWHSEKNGMVQYCGKDNLRQQSAMWQAMLMAAGLPNSAHIIVDGFVTGDGGIKMSKSLGNTVDPMAVVTEYGTDALRYFVARELHPFEDSPFTMEKFKEAYNANLANGLGNVVSRIMKMAATNIEKPVAPAADPAFSDATAAAMRGYDLKSALDSIWARIKKLDETIQKEQPFKVMKTDAAKGIALIEELVRGLASLAVSLDPFLPETAKKIKVLVEKNEMPAAPLFPRKDQIVL